MTGKVNSQQEMTATMQWNVEVVKLVIFEGARLIFLGELVWVLCKSLWALFWMCHRYSLWMRAHCSTSGLLPPGFQGSMESD